MRSVTDHARSTQSGHSVVDHVLSRTEEPQHSVLDHAHGSDSISCQEVQPAVIEQSLQTFNPPVHRQGSLLKSLVQPNSAPKGSMTVSLDPGAKSFVARDPSLVHGGILVPDLDSDWFLVQQKQTGVPNHLTSTNCELWNFHPSERIGEASPQQSLELSPAVPTLRTSCLPEVLVQTPFGHFKDRLLPPSPHMLLLSETFPPEYFLALHNVVAAPGVRADGSCYPAFTPNYVGARIALRHTRLQIERWRFHLVGYENVEVVQHLEFGFPLGLENLPVLSSSVRNHGSSYNFFEHVDKFVTDEVVKGGVSGPLQKSPWWNAVVSPMMTAPKKPSSRRTVFDASYGENSLNGATPGDLYLGQPCIYTYPKIDDF